jgi:hypothetical protein
LMMERVRSTAIATPGAEKIEENQALPAPVKPGDFNLRRASAAMKIHAG